MIILRKNLTPKFKESKQLKDRKRKYMFASKTKITF